MSENTEKQEGLMPLTISPPQQSALASYSTEDASKILSQLININADNILHEPTCILCGSPYRKDIEQKWVETKKYDDVKKLFQEKTGLTISKDVMDNHLLYHFDRGVKELQKVEYVDRIKRLSGCNLTTLQRIRLCCDALTERLMGVNSIVPTGEIGNADIEKIKSSETTKIMVAFNQLLKLQASILGEMKTSGELITIPRKDFVTIFNEAIATSKTDGERDVIRQILNKLADISRSMQ
jgi:hypothetical protein